MNRAEYLSARIIVAADKMNKSKESLRECASHSFASENYVVPHLANTLNNYYFSNVNKYAYVTKVLPPYYTLLCNSECIATIG